jgi:hypothetical protein
MPAKGLKMLSHLTNLCGQHNTALRTTVARKQQAERAKFNNCISTAET